MNVLITGITGSGGSYLAEYILENHPEWQVWGTSRWHSTSVLNNIKNIKYKIIVKECDLNDLSSIIRLLEECRPLKIFHLAATANVRTCFDTPLSVFQNNAIGTSNLFEAIRMTCPGCTILHASTSEVYGNPVYFPMREDHPIRPVNPYSSSKVAQEALAFAWGQSWKMNIIITRAFAYLNFRRKDLFSTAFAMQIARIEAGKQKILKHGNLQSIRTLMHIEDMCRAYWIASEKFFPLDPYNIGGKDIVSVEGFLNLLIKQSTAPIICEQDNNLIRPKDVDRQICDVSKFYNKTGFEVKYTLEDGINKLLEDCREEVFYET